MGIHIIARDDKGAVLTCLNSSQPCNSQVVVAKCRALLRATEFCREVGFQHVEFEGDALVKVRALSRKEVCCASYGFLIEEAKQLLQVNSSWIISFIHREGNSAAHSLANLGLSSDCEHVWIEEVPLSSSLL